MSDAFSLWRSCFPSWFDEFALLLVHAVLGLDDLVGWNFCLLTCRNHFDTRLCHFSLQRNGFVERQNGLVTCLPRLVRGLDDFAEWNFYFPTWKNDSDTGLVYSDTVQNRYFAWRNGVNIWQISYDYHAALVYRL